MKSKSRFLFAASLALVATSFVFAGTYYWDPNGSGTADFGTADGTWGSSAFWNTDSSGGSGGTIANTTITTADDIFFGTNSVGLGAGTVTGPSSAQGFLNMTFGSASGAIILSGGFLNLDTTTGSTITVNNASNTISTVLQGTGGKLIKSGSGTLILTSNQTYTGETVVNQGILNLNLTTNPASGGLNTSSGITINNGGQILVSSWNALHGYNSTGVGTVTINAGGLMTTANDVTSHIRGALALYGGTLASGTPNGTFGSWNLNGNVTAGGTATSTISATRVNWGGTRTFTVSDAAGNLNVTGFFEGSGALTKEGDGTMTLAGYNTYTGGTTVNDGTLTLGVGGVTGAIRGTLDINNATVKLNAGDALGYVTGVTQINIVGGTLDNAVANNNSYFAGWSLTGGNMTSTGGGAYHILASSKSISSLASSTTSTISGNVAIRGANSNLVIDVADGAAATDLLMSGVISNSPFEAGANRITKNGAGTLTLSGASTYSGGTTLNNGTLLLGINTTGTITNGPVGTGTLTLAGGTLGFSANSLTISNAINVTGTTIIGQAASNSATLSGAITGNGTLKNYNGGTSNSNNFFFTNNFSGFTGTIEYTGSSTATTAWWRVGATGGTTVNLSGATLNLVAGTGDAKNFGFLDGTTVVNTLRLSRLTGDGVFQGSFLGSATNVIEVGNGDASSTFSGVIGRSGANMDRISLNKVGAGTLTLSGANIHTGGTTVTAGTLVVNNTAGSGTGTGTVAVSAGATLKGTGSISGATTFAADPDGAGAGVGAIHSPGNSVGAQKFTNNVTYADGSIFEWEINRAATQTRGTGYDAVNVTGTLAGLDGDDAGTTNDAIFRIVITDADFSNSFWSTSKSWSDIFTDADGTTAKTDWTSIFSGGFKYFYNNGTTLTSISGPDAGTIGSFSFTGGNTLTWTAVPEPTSALVGLLIGAGLLRRRRA